jgi:hypothetical protein
MEAHAHHGHHDVPTSGRALDALALSATLHCLTGCAIGEVTGMIIGTALGWSEWATVALAVALAFLFGYTLRRGGRLVLMSSGRRLLVRSSVSECVRSAAEPRCGALPVDPGRHLERPVAQEHA